MAGKASILDHASAVRLAIGDWPDVRVPRGLKKSPKKGGARAQQSSDVLRLNLGPDVRISVGMTGRLGGVGGDKK